MTRSLDQALLQGADVSAMANTNLFVNGFMAISQEAGTTAGTSNGRYPVDQFQCPYSIGAVTSGQVATPFPTMPEIAFGTKVTVATAGTPSSATDISHLLQNIEGLNLAKLRYGAANAMPVTVAFMILPTFTGVIGWRLYSFASNKSFVKRIALTAGQLQFVSFTIPGDTLAALLTTNVASFQAAWILAVGSNYLTATTDQWVAGNYCAPTDQTNVMGTVGNAFTVSACVMLPGEFRITQAMLPLLQRQYDDELRKCMRYYQKPTWNWRVTAPANGYWDYSIFLTVPMRTSPSVNLVSQYNNSSANVNSFSMTSQSTTEIRVEVTTPGGGDTYTIIATGSANARM